MSGPTVERTIADTVFTPVLRRLVERVPGARGAVFAAWDGEAVDHHSLDSVDDVLVQAAHYGIVLNLAQSALHLFHFGEAREIIIDHERATLLLRVVSDGYYLLVVLEPATHLATALRESAAAAAALAGEM